MSARRQRRPEQIRLFDEGGERVDVRSVLALMDAWADAALLVVQDRRAIAANASLRRALGVHPSAVVGRDAYELLFPDGGAPEECPLATAVSEDLDRRTSCWERRDTGRWLEAAVTRTPFVTRSGKAVFLFRQRDVSEREEILRQSKLRTQELEALRDLLLLDPTVPLDVLLQLALERLVDLSWLGMERRGIAFLADGEGNLTMRAAVGLDNAAIARCTRVPRGDCVCGRAAAEGVLIHVGEAGREHTRSHSRRPHGHYCVPLASEDRLLGVLTFYLPPGHQPSRREAAFLRSAAGVVSVMVERARGQQALARQHRRVIETLDASVRTMGRMLGVQAPHIVTHQEQVAELAHAIGQQLGMDEHRLQGLVLAASLHDIGKIGVSRELLGKEGPLSDEEQALVRTHVAIGCGFLDASAFAWPVVEMVRQHHEAWDGSGYPAGLAGEEILLEARILAAANTVEALASDRPHRSGRGLTAGSRALLEGRGTLFDPQVVDAFMALTQRDGLPGWLKG